MRILHLDSGREWRGGQQQVFFLAEGLQQLRLEQSLLIEATSPLAARLERLDLSVRRFRFRGEINPLSALGLKRVLGRFKPDLVHAHDSKTLGLAAFVKFFSSPFPLIGSRRVAFPLKGNPLRKLKYQRMANCIIAVSDFVRDQLLAEGIPASKVVRIYDGYQPISFAHPALRREARSQWGITDQNTVIGTVGRMTSEKGQADLLQGFALLQKDVPSARLLLAGDGPLRPQLEAMAEGLGIRSSVLFTGDVKPLEPILALLDCFVLPSRWEGLGSILLLAIEQGIPICASRTGGIPELIRDGETGRLFPPAAPQAIAHRVKEVFANPAQTQRLADQAKEMVLRDFQVDGMVTKTYNLYRQILGGGPIGENT
jgi:glycosyltransferase involved in cell wall biosynthesis